MEDKSTKTSTSDTFGEGSQPKFKASSVCVKMKFDALKENLNTEENNFIVIHEMYQCGKCYKLFNEESALSDHCCVFENEIDPSAGLDKDRLKSICSKISKNYVYDCDQCDLSFSQKRQLRKHRKIHKVKKECPILECEPCGLKFDDKDSLLQHKKIHYTEKRFRCKVCYRQFSYEKYLVCHMQKHHQKLPQCNICDKVFQNVQNLYRHKSLHNPPNSKRYTCEICNASFRLNAYLKNHSLSHTEERPFMCEKCGKTYKRASDLKKHYETSHNISHYGERPLMCEKCGMRFTRKYHLQRHYETHDTLTNFTRTPNRRYVCDKCGKSFSSKYVLQIHSYIHTGEKPCKCDVCPKAFRYKELLKNHMFTHSNIKHSCDICNKEYSTKRNLEKHMRIHNDDLAVECDVCSMKFAYKSQLVSHYVIHTKEKPYECEKCHKRFTQKSSMTKHICCRTEEKSSAEILLSLMSSNENSS